MMHGLHVFCCDADLVKQKFLSGWAAAICPASALGCALMEGRMELIENRLEKWIFVWNSATLSHDFSTGDFKFSCVRSSFEKFNEKDWCHIFVCCGRSRESDSACITAMFPIWFMVIMHFVGMPIMPSSSSLWGTSSSLSNICYNTVVSDSEVSTRPLFLHFSARNLVQGDRAE